MPAQNLSGSCAGILYAVVQQGEGSLVQRVDFPASGENVSFADKRSAGSTGLSADRLAEGSFYRSENIHLLDILKFIYHFS